VALEKPRLAETAYGLREVCGEKQISQRVELHKLAYTGINPKFDLDYLKNQIVSIADNKIKSLVHSVYERIKELPDKDAEQQWIQEISVLRISQNGSPIKKVTQFSPFSEEYTDLSKDGSGAFYKRKENHKGQFVYATTEKKKGGKESLKYHVRPVYVFESVPKVCDSLKAQYGDNFKDCGFFQSGCLIRIDRPVVHSATVRLESGVYKLNTIRTSGQTTVTSIIGVISPKIRIQKFIEAGMSRCK